MRLSDFIQGVGQPFPYYPAIAKLIGVKECIFLCRLIWWTGMEKAGDGWIYKTQLDFQNETGMSFDEQSNARKNLKRLGLLEERHQRLQHKMFYKVNLEALNDKWEASAPIPETGKPGFGESENPVSSEPANPVSSNTTEETQKRPTKNAAPAAAASFAKVFVEGWSAAYEADRGVKYVFGGAKDGSAVKRLAATGVSSADLLTICLLYTSDAADE